MDGFEIELDVDFDEPLMVSRDEPYKAPEYSGGAKCIICASVFAETVEAVLHIHKIHNIKVVGECSISSFFSGTSLYLSPREALPTSWWMRSGCSKPATWLR